MPVTPQTQFRAMPVLLPLMPTCGLVRTVGGRRLQWRRPYRSRPRCWKLMMKLGAMLPMPRSWPLWCPGQRREGRPGGENRARAWSALEALIAAGMCTLQALGRYAGPPIHPDSRRGVWAARGRGGGLGGCDATQLNATQSNGDGDRHEHVAGGYAPRWSGG
jgi:hypothetical protein